MLTFSPITNAIDRQPAALDKAMAALDQRCSWRNPPDLTLPRHPAERFLKNWVIVIDPGHGGDAHRPGYKRGPTGVREADANFRVAVLLEQLLAEAGAHVVMTRAGDYYVSLADRARVANTVKRPDGGIGADLFISIHHNASEDPETNYTSVWFHGEADWSEPDLDVSRYIAHALARHLRTDAGVTSFLMSDRQMFRGGFGVLRQTRVPAILLESSFHTNPAEEQRLRDAFHNLREAYAIYEALVEYAYGGRPTQGALEFEPDGDDLRLAVDIDDGLPKTWWGADRNRTIISTAQVFLDDKPVLTHFDPKTKRLTATLPGLARAGEITRRHVLRIHHANFAKHHNWPQRYLLTIASGDAGALAINTQAMGAYRAGFNSAIAAAIDDEPVETAGPKRKARPTPPQIHQGPEALDETRQRIAGARPGDIVTIEELPARVIPRLPLRIAALESPRLLLSNMPEHFRAGDGIAMQESVSPGMIRLYVHHAPYPSDGGKTITAIIENIGDKPMALKFYRYSFPRPSKHRLLIAKTGLIEFFESARPGLEPRVIAPGKRAPVDPAMDQTIALRDQLVHGIYEFYIDQPARITVFQRYPGHDSATVMDQLPLLPRTFSGIDPNYASRGLFQISDFLVTLPGHLKLDTANGSQQLVVADGRDDPWIRGVDGMTGEVVENRGNHGVIYRIRLQRSSSDGRSLAVFMHNLDPLDDYRRNLVAAVKVSDGVFPGGVVPIPNNRVFFDGLHDNVLIQVFPPLPGGETETIEIVYSPPIGSSLPIPIFFVPF